MNKKIEINRTTKLRIVSQRFGLTIIEVLLACGVVSLVVLAITQNMTTVNKVSKGITLQSSWINLLSTIQLNFNNLSSCQAIVSGWGNLNNEETPSVGGSIPAYFLTKLTKNGTLLLQTGKVINGVYIHSIKLMEIPGFTTQVSNGSYADSVYLEIRAKRIVSPADQALVNNSVISESSMDLFSGYNNKTPITPIMFTIVREGNGNVVNCQPTVMACSDLGGNYVGLDQISHQNHTHPACQLPNFTLNADSSNLSKIAFGDLYQPNSSVVNTPSPSVPSPDQISDDVLKHEMTLSAQVTNLSASGSGGVSVAAANFTVNGPVKIAQSLTVNGNALLRANCSVNSCLSGKFCSCLPGFSSLFSGGGNCSTGEGIKLSYAFSPTVWTVECNNGLLPRNVFAYCCGSTQ